MQTNLARRHFLSFLAASPFAPIALKKALARPDLAEPETLDQVLNIAHLDKVAQRVLDPKAYHFIVAASDDHRTMLANEAAYDAVYLRPRRLVDVSTVSTAVTLFGQELRSPLLLAPIGGQQTVHPDGELATAKAAKAKKHLMICSTMTNASIGEIAEVGGDLWFQLYASKSRAFMKKLMDDAEAAGCTGIVLTVDSPAQGNREAQKWFSSLPDPTQKRSFPRIGNFENFDGPKGIGNPALTWEDLAWFRDNTDLNFLLKGIVTAEDADLCVVHGVDGVIVSNHGGRQEGNGQGTLNALREIAPVLKGKMPVLIDGGIRRGTDIFSALALGADAVCIGRPYMWGLGAFGQAGVEKCLSLLQAELVRAMRFAGVTKLSDITSSHIGEGK